MPEYKSEHNDPKDDLDQIVSDIERARKRLIRFRFARRILFSTTAASVILAAFVWVESFLYLSEWIKSSLLTLLFVTAAISYLISSHRNKDLSFSSFYHGFTKRAELPELRNLLDLNYSDRESSSRFYSASLQYNLKKQNLSALAKSLTHYLDQHPITRSLKQTALIGSISIMLLALSMVMTGDALYRLSNFWESYEKPNPYAFEINPKDTTIEQGSSAKVSVIFSGSDYPEELALGIRTSVEENYRYIPVIAVNDSMYEAVLKSVNGNLSYYLEMDGFSSKTYAINVQLLPRIQELTVTLSPPPYTQLKPSQYRYPFSGVSGYTGSLLEIRGKINKPLSDLAIRSKAKRDTSSLSVDSLFSFTHTYKIGPDDTLLFFLRDKNGLRNRNDFAFRVDQIQDEAPFVSITEPSGERTISEPDSLQLIYEARDDFGLSKATLNYELSRAFVSEPELSSKALAPPANGTLQEITWNLKPLRLKPRDEVTYWIEVWDNDRINGSKKGISQKMILRVPSLTEYFEDVDRREQTITESLDEVSENYENIDREFEELKQKIREGDESNWEQTQKLDELKEERSKLNEKVDQLNEQFEELKRQLDQENMLSEETLKSYQELQKLMEDIKDPEILEMIDELRKSLNSYDQQQLKDALDKLEFNEELYKEKLNRTVELFKNLKLNSDLEKLAKSLESLSEQEENLSRSKESTQKQKSQQEAIERDLNDLQKSLKKLNKNATKKSESKVEKLQEEAQEEFESIQQELKENIEKLDQLNKDSQRDSTTSSGQQDQQKQEIQQQQQQIQQQMKQLAERMRSAQQQMSQQQMQVNIAALEHILYALVNQSEAQENLTNETEQLADKSQAFVAKARIQKNISDQFSQIADSLYAVSAEIPQFSNKITEKKLVVERNLTQAIDQLAERNRRQSTTAERQSLGGINELATMIASLLDQLNNQSGGGGGGGMSAQQMMEQMQKMSGDQQKLNQQIQDMINDIQGERLSKDKLNKLNSLAKRQNQIRKQLEELKRNGGLESGDKALSELERLSEEMENAINDLRGGALDRPFLKRQQNILSRMLEAEKAMQERGEEKKREADRPDQLPKSVSPDITLEELKKMIRTRLQDPNQTKFTEDYQRLIEQYFELLEEQERQKEVSS